MTNIFFYEADFNYGNPSGSVPIDQEGRIESIKLAAKKYSLKALGYKKLKDVPDEDNFPYMAIEVGFETGATSPESKTYWKNEWVGVLQELVALKDMEERNMFGVGMNKEQQEDYLKRKPLAWAAARELLKSVNI